MPAPGGPQYANTVYEQEVLMTIPTLPKAGKAANAQNSSAGGAAAGGGSISVGDAATSAEPNWLLIAGIVTVVALVAVALIARARHNKDRAAAYARESASAL